MNKFSNHFLISMPHLKDSIFEKSLIYIFQHDSYGAMGLILNKTLDSKHHQKTIIDTGIFDIEPVPEVYSGGPLQPEIGLVLHDSSYKSSHKLKVCESIHLSPNSQIITDIKNKKGPKNYIFLLGYSGWEQGQLEDEIECGDWLVTPSNYDFIFKHPNQYKWSEAAIQFGIDINIFSGGKSGRA